jgi:hypothetical protein
LGEKLLINKLFFLFLSRSLYLSHFTILQFFIV